MSRVLFHRMRKELNCYHGICKVKKLNTADLLARVHTGVYAQKHPCHYYGNQSHLQLVYGITRARYTILHAVSSLQSAGALGMSLLETSSSYMLVCNSTFSWHARNINFALLSDIIPSTHQILANSVSHGNGRDPHQF